jgi:hypothetical protein
LAIGLGLGFLDPLGLFCFVKPPTDPILIQGEINAVRMDLDARRRWVGARNPRHRPCASYCPRQHNPGLVGGRGAGKAPNTRQLGPRALLYLYRIAHSERR